MYAEVGDAKIIKKVPPIKEFVKQILKCKPEPVLCYGRICLQCSGGASGTRTSSARAGDKKRNDTLTQLCGEELREGPEVCTSRDWAILPLWRPHGKSSQDQKQAFETTLERRWFSPQSYSSESRTGRCYSHRK